MDRKKFIPLLLSSAMAFMWACGEGNISGVTDDDERVKATLLEKLDSTKKDYKKNVEEFLKPYFEYCKSKKGHEDGCEADIVKFSSSSKNGGETPKSSSSGNTSKSSSSGNANTSSSKGGNSSPSGSSSSSISANSSSSVASSSSVKLEAKGKCVLSMPDVVYVGDEISWRYLPDEGSLQEAEFAWSFNDDDAKNWTVDGKITGTGTPEILVTFKSKGVKVAPTLTFGSKGFECKNVKVLAKDDPVSSSSEAESSSSEPESSSATPESSAAKGYCAVSTRKANVDQLVEWYIVDAEGHELVGSHQWYDLGKDGTLVDGEKSGTGSTRIKVKYSTPGVKSPTAYWGTDAVTCERNELDDDDFDALLDVIAQPVSSSSESPIIEESSSSGEIVLPSSSSKELDICDPNNPEYDPGQCVF
ncbi:MAG: hypothetical protein IJM92_04930 [Fibrobacter sp.]|uniref:hypothetical protein n=1 Tax=Fibrobacter sp. TaxID=35828 RepID=UPI0025C40151|nr:hypothetical protein [Fibrobacter sp.]MBQ7079005.1 hypothetical protein [Fibrobacter sp.]